MNYKTSRSPQLPFDVPKAIWLIDMGLRKARRHAGVESWQHFSFGFLILHLVLGVSLTFLTAEAARQTGVCQFPTKWQGTWFQSGVRSLILIQKDKISNKGNCLSSDGDKFLVVDDKDCYRCVVIHEKHVNVLQYKETYCHRRGEDLSRLCSLITGDALLYSMFRVDAEPVPCPFKGPFTFTYDRGHGYCKNPVSSIDSCTEDSSLLLRYQACPDVSGTESTVEELLCLATWKEGSSRYLVGKVSHNHATSNEDRYRCFVYEKSTEEQQKNFDFRVAQSGDATCNGLFTATEGSRTMTLMKAPSPSKCKFPSWVTVSSHWHTLDYRTSYQFSHKNTTLKITNSSYQGQEKRVVCTEVKNSSSEFTHLVTHVTQGCQSEYVCMMFYRRDGHVIEVQTGAGTRRPEDACLPLHFNQSSLPFVTLVTASPEPKECPYMGKFSVTGVSHDERKVRDSTCSQDFTTLVVGCSTMDTMEFRSDCMQPDIVRSYSCHGRWEDNGTHFLITTPLSRSSIGARRFCFIYRELEGVVQFSSSSDSCQRNISPGIGGALAFNVTSSGQCVEVNGDARKEASAIVVVIATVFTTWRAR